MPIVPHPPRRRTAGRARAPRRLGVEGLERRLVLATLPANFSESVIAAGIANATAMEIAPEGRLWVLEQGGSVEVFHAGSTTGATALTIPASAINASGERGLLGIAFDPAYNVADAALDYVYLYYTSTSSPNPHNRISRFTVNNADPDRPTLFGERVLVDLDPLSAATNHNGGAIHFGPDGKLYVAVGDNAQGANAQSLANRLGKVLRYNADGTIPADNPSLFPGISGATTGANRAIWAVGLRNPYTFTFQPGTGRMHINDVGQNTTEEIDVGAAGANYGWPLTEGDFNQASFPNFTRPFYTYTHGTGTFQGFAITGGAFYNPASPGLGRFPASYDGDYFFADFSNSWIDVIDTATRAVTQFATAAPGTVDLRVAPDGALLYLARNAGSVFRVVSTVNQAPVITGQPRDQSAGLGGSATFTVAAGGSAPLAYQWQRAEAGTTAFAPIAGATSASYAVGNLQVPDNGDRFRVVVSNAFGSVTSAPASLIVNSDRVPEATITIDSGLADGRFTAGRAITFSGVGTDAEDGNLAAGRFSYRVDYITSINSGSPAVRPFLPEVSGQSSGRFTPATVGPYTLADVAYRVVLTVTDSAGQATTVARDIAPNVARITVATDPPGLRVTVDGQPSLAPIAFDGVVGFERPIGAAASQSLGGTPYRFVAWSDGGPAIHTIATPAVATTYTASYVVAPPSTRPPANYDGSGRTNLAVYLPAFGGFAFRPTGGGPDVIVPFGPPGPGQTIPTTGDYDGDGRADLAAFLPAFGGGYAYRPSGGGPDVLTPFGIPGPGQSIPSPADFDGDGRDDITVYLAALGAFGTRPSAGGPDQITPFGFAGAGQTLPAPADYFGSGRDAIAAYLPALGAFAIRPPGGGADLIIPFGLAGAGQSIPIPGDYDGDGRADLAVYLPSFGLFAYRPTGGGPDVLQAFGTAGDGSIPVPGDYSGSGRTEIAIFNPNFGVFAFRPAGGAPDVIVAFGSAGVGASIPAAAPPTVPAAPAVRAATATVSKKSAVPRGPARVVASVARPVVARVDPGRPADGA